MFFKPEIDPKCPKCGEECSRDSVDVGVGVIYGPWGCICGWSSDPHYDASNGPSPAQLVAGDGKWVDSRGGVHSVDRIADNLARFGVPREHVADVFRVGPKPETTDPEAV